jgi:hypothetical protein
MVSAMRLKSCPFRTALSIRTVSDANDVTSDSISLKIRRNASKLKMKNACC